jgi:hypothetical protein
MPTAAQTKEHGHEERHFKVTPPANVREAWLLVATKVKDAERLLADKQTEAVHEIGEQLEAAVHVLKEKSTMVAGDKDKHMGWKRWASRSSGRSMRRERSCTVLVAVVS